MGNLDVKTTEKLIREAKPGATADGKVTGLYLKIGPSGAASWQLRYQINGKRRSKGLGACSTENVRLAEAREEANELKKLIRDGIDPIEQGKALATQAKGAKTFADTAKEYIDGRADGWKNKKHVAQWRATLATYGAKFSDKPVGDVTIDDAEDALRTIWLAKSETATRVLTRITSVLTYAHDKGYRKDDDAETWGLRLRRRLPNMPKKSERVTHHPALPYAQVEAFIKALHPRGADAAHALEFLILCGSRSGEVRLATWSEFDLDSETWIIPAQRMKMKREHRVPLSKQATVLLRQRHAKASADGQQPEGDAFVFPGARVGRPLSDMSLTACIRKRNAKKPTWTDEQGEPIVPHGFRSSFRDWAAEATAFPSEVVEMALAHVVANKVEAAYRRGDLFEKRRLLMQEWADFCSPQATRPCNCCIFTTRRQSPAFLRLNPRLCTHFCKVA